MTSETVFTIITPSFNMLDYLPQCCASIRDQVDDSVKVEHIVVDGTSKDGTVEWLEKQSGTRITKKDFDYSSVPFSKGYRFLWISEPDQGMYDAINKGFNQASGQYISYLNCDEQYLSETLIQVRHSFETNPSVQGIYGNMIVIDSKGKLLAFRKSPPLRRWYLKCLHLYVPSCATFWKRQIIDDGHRFNPKYKAAGDYELCMRLLNAKLYRFKHVHKYLAAFTFTGANLGHNPPQERRMSYGSRLASRPIRMIYRLEKLIRGCYRQSEPIEYSLYTPASQKERKPFRETECRHIWPN